VGTVYRGRRASQRRASTEKQRACFTVLLMTDGCLLLSGTAFAHQCLRNVLILSRG
jgi:hypothetical protein